MCIGPRNTPRRLWTSAKTKMEDHELEHKHLELKHKRNMEDLRSKMEKEVQESALKVEEVSETYKAEASVAKRLMSRMRTNLEHTCIDEAEKEAHIKKVAIIWEKARDLQLAARLFEENERKGASRHGVPDLPDVPGFCFKHVLEQASQVHEEKQTEVKVTKATERSQNNLTAFGILYQSGTVEITSKETVGVIESINKRKSDKLMVVAEKKAKRAKTKKDNFEMIAQEVVEAFARNKRLKANALQRYLKGERQRLLEKGLPTNLVQAAQIEKMLKLKRSAFMKAAEKFSKRQLQSRIRKEPNRPLTEREVVPNDDETADPTETCEQRVNSIML